MILEIENNEEENGISVIIDCSNSKMTVKGSNNGDKPDICTFKTGSFVDIRTIGPKQVFHFRIESNRSSGNGSGEARPEIVQVDPVDSQVDSSVTEPKIGAVSLLIESLRRSKEVRPKIIQDVDPADSQGNDTKVIKTESSVEAVPSLITAEEIAKEISEAVILKKDGIRILAALIERGSLRRKDLSGINVFISNIPRALKKLGEAGLIYYENDKKFIKPNFEKITVSCPWLYSKEIRTIVAESDFRLGRSVQYVLYLLCKYRNGLSHDIILNGVGFSKPGFYIVKRTMTGYDLIEVVGSGGKVIIFPKFSIDQIKENLANQQKQISTQEMVEASPVIPINTVEGFNIERLEGFVNMVKRGPPNVKLQTLSSQLKAGISDGKISKLLDAINERIEIEIVNIGTGEIMTSWELKYFRSKKFKSVVFENLEIRMRSSNLEEEDTKTKDVKEQEIVPVSGENLVEPEDDEITEEQKRENITKKIEGMITTPNLGSSHKVVLTILLDNYLSNNSFQMRVSDLIESSSRQNLEEAQVRVCFGGLQALRFIEKPNEIIELNIET